VNGVVGIKPTVGLVSARGIVPLAPSQDTAGPFGRTVADAALLLDVLVESDTARAVARPLPVRQSLRGVRIGVVRNTFGADRDAIVESTFAAAVELLEAAGAVLVDPADPWFGHEASAAEFTLLLAEFRDSVAQYLSRVSRGPRTLNELIEFNAAQAPDVMPYFGQELLLAARDSGGTADVAYRSAVATIAEQRRQLAQLFAAQQLDALVAPANARAWRTDYRSGDAVGVSSSSIAAVSGYPSIVVPMSVAADLPLGVAFIGKPREEAPLIEIATVVERLRGPFPQPQFLPSTAD
jgi:amidase